MNPASGLVLPLQAAPGGSLFEMLFPFLLIFLVFYFLLIRPQQKKQREHEEMQRSVKRGDRVVTTGGIHGVVTGCTDLVLTVEVGTTKSGPVRVKVDRKAIERVEKAEEGS